MASARLRSACGLDIKEPSNSTPAPSMAVPGTSISAGAAWHTDATEERRFTRLVTLPTVMSGPRSDAGLRSKNIPDLRYQASFFGLQVQPRTALNHASA